MSSVPSMAFRNLRRRKLRTCLTLLGIVVGVSLMVALFAIGEGMNVQISQQIRALGGADITIYNSTEAAVPRRIGFIGDPMSEALVAEVQATPGVDLATGVLSGLGEVHVVGVPPQWVNKNQTLIMGIDPESYDYITGGVHIIEGRALQPSDVYGAVIGVTLANETGVSVGGVLYTMKWGGAKDSPGISFVVVGICRTGQTHLDRAMFIQLKQAQHILQWKRIRAGTYVATAPQITQILVKVKDPSEAQAVAGRIEEKLSGMNGIRVFVASQMLQRMQQGISTLVLFLEGIGSVAIVAGSIGIMNTMMMSVFERTREIGIMKAIGAKPRDILITILTEAMLIGVLAGAIGCVVGVAGTLFWGELSTSSRYGGMIISIKPIITPVILLETFGLGVLVGVLAGLYPAWRASRLDPVEALRHGG
ncbi:ABC transporter permease [Candidatus Bathyarchaeota archaeon]|nr:ABC transporter permease [Candidatus Bathyarchaeota archaeon]